MSWTKQRGQKENDPQEEMTLKLLHSDNYNIITVLHS